jgi:hypothetical protein
VPKSAPGYTANDLCTAPRNNAHVVRRSRVGDLQAVRHCKACGYFYLNRINAGWPA